MTDNFFGKTLAARKIDAIPGMLEFDIPVHGDNRGWFKENFQKEKMLPLGFPESFFAEGKLQNNVSFSRKNVLRGLHAEPWDKYISVADGGKVLGSWVDLREGETFVSACFKLFKSISPMRVIVVGLNTGISGFPSVSKSMEGISLKRPTASFTAASRICQMACSFSNFISVFVG